MSRWPAYRDRVSGHRPHRSHAAPAGGCGADGTGGDPIERFWDELIRCHGDLPALLAVVADRVVRLVGDGCVLTMVGEDGTLLEPVQVAHADPVAREAMCEVLGSRASRIGEGIAGRVAADRRPVVLNDIPPPVYEETTPERYHTFLRSHPMRALMVAPLVVGNELYGTLGAVRTESNRPYTEDDLATLQALGERAALAIADAVSPHRALEPADHEALFRHSVDGILFVSTPDAVVLTANPAACRILRMTERQMVEGGREALFVQGPELDDALAQRAAVGHVRAQLTMRRGDGTVFPADVHSSLFSTDGGAVRAIVEFRDMTVEEALKDAVRRKMAELEHAADLDPLTGLLNRRGFHIASASTLAAADRAGHTVQLVFVDVDGLKSINDRAGHAAGDATIVAVAQAISRSVRQGDIACRLGGDEFVVLMVDTTADEARAVVDRIGEELAEDTAAPGTTVSAGITERKPNDEATLDHYIDVADREMYQRKMIRRLRAGG